MKTLRFLFPNRLALVVFLGLTLSKAQAQVSATLVAAESSIQPGRPFTVALHFDQEPRWHTYWVNPGIGVATTLAWKLPDGWKAGDIQWPVPETITDNMGAVSGNGYEGELFLPVTITPPADLKPGTKVELKATANWLMCSDQCVPGSADVAITLPISGDKPTEDPAWGHALHGVLAALPSADPDWMISASRDAKNVTLAITPRTPGSHRPQSLHFFSDDNLVAYDKPQTVKEDGKGGVILTLPVSDDAPKDSPKLLGVLASANGWHADGSLAGLRIEVPFTDAKSAMAPIGSPASTAPTATGSGATGSAGPAGGLISTLFLAFVGGLILNLMPCVFPVLGLKILGFVNQSGASRGKVVAHGLVFAAGVLVSFWALAGLLIALRAGGAHLGWGFQLQSPGFIFLLAAGLLVFALNLSGVFEFGLSATGVGGSLQGRSGYAGSFFTGLLATLVATPCSAPFLAPALGAALALTAGKSLVVFTVIAIGLSTPYLLLSLFPGAVRILPRPGKWMETFKQFMAFPLYATVAYLLWVLGGQTTETGQLTAMFGLVLFAMGVWVYGRLAGIGASATRSRIGLVAGILILGVGSWAGWPRVPVPDAVTWEKWSPDTVAKLRGEGRTIYIDFTARWCATCQANKRIVFHSGNVLQVFRDENIATLRGDWTNNDPEITAELAKYNRSAVPFNLIWVPGAEKPVILPEILSPGIVLKALKGRSGDINSPENG